MKQKYLPAALMCVCLFFSMVSTAQDLNLKTLEGNATNLSSQLSKTMWTLVMVWTTYCGECAKQYNEISAFHQSNKKSRLQVVGVSLDGLNQKTKVRRYALIKNHTFPSVLAESDNFANKYTELTGATFTGTPTYMLFDRERSIQAYMDGPISIDALERFIDQSDLSKG
jgi:peroxiredoxin